MESKTFILNKKKTFRRGVRIFVKDLNGKMEMRTCKFTTEHKVSPKDRRKKARTVAAEYTTSEPQIIEAMMRDSSYGKTFTLATDPEGELKEKTIVITPHDARRIALETICNEAGVLYDENTPVDVLAEKYKIHISALAGKPVDGGGVKIIPFSKENVLGNIQASKEAARNAYKEKYGEDVPVEVFDDVAFLDGLANPDFDAKKYIKGLEPEESVPANEVTIESLREDYFAKYNKHVANPKKNDSAWIKAQLEKE